MTELYLDRKRLGYHRAGETPLTTRLPQGGEVSSVSFSRVSKTDDTKRTWMRSSSTFAGKLFAEILQQQRVWMMIIMTSMDIERILDETMGKPDERREAADLADRERKVIVRYCEITAGSPLECKIWRFQNGGAGSKSMK